MTDSWNALDGNDADWSGAKSPFAEVHVRADKLEDGLSVLQERRSVVDQRVAWKSKFLEVDSDIVNNDDVVQVVGLTVEDGWEP